MTEVELPASVKAAVLCDALPYIRRFAGRTVVVKYGGNAARARRLSEPVGGTGERRPGDRARCSSSPRTSSFCDQ